MSYVVLARKWRPNQFDEVVGQGHVARTLMNAIEQDRVAHAFLFAGARGVGKTSTARILAKALNCKNGPTTTPCDECIACTEIKHGQAVDVFEIDGASNRGINEIRELRESVRYAPSRDEYKIYIIDEVHMLTTEAFNALLKTLEEPPPHAKFIFATTEPQKIPVTILSRCQRYDFKRVSQKDIVGHLENICGSEGIAAEKGALQIIARQAAGGVRDALSLLDQIISFSEDEITEEQVGEVLGVANRRQLFELSDAVIARDAEGALKVLDDVNRYGYDLGQFAAELVSHFRDLTVIKVVEDPGAVTDLTESEIETANAQIESAPVNLLHRYFSVMAEATQELARSSFPKLIFEMTLVRLTRLEPLVGIDLLVDRLHSLEDELDDAEPIPPRTGEEGSENPSRRQPAPGRKATPPAESARQSGRDRPQATADRPQATGEKRATAPKGLEADSSDAAPEEDNTPTGRWKRLIAALIEDHRPLAMTCEHAFVERFEDGVIEISLPPQFAELVNEPERIQIVRDAITQLFGDEWNLEIANTPSDDDSKAKTIAQERDEDIAQRHKTLEDALRNHDVVKQAQDLFDVDPNDVRVQVKLFDDSPES